MRNTDGTVETDLVKLLLVDDHLVLRQALTEVLAGKGKYSVVGEASDGLELLDLLPSARPDIIIMDLAMPKANGLTTIEELRRRGVTAPILVLSADESDKSIRAALKAGARGFLPKQVGLSEVEFAIDAVLAGKTYLSPSITERFMASGGVEGGAPSPVSCLSEREKEIFILLANGKPNRDIGKQLHISTRTVDTHRSNIMKKLNVKANTELVKLAISEGLVSV
jgi:DNA-binding NarL/FixJ family response regulator